MHGVNTYQRYQRHLNMMHIYPKQDGVCSCGCGKKLTGKRTRWATNECSQKAYDLFSIIKGGSSQVRHFVFKRDKGYCSACGVYDEKWQADHIVPVYKGGGGCGLDNYQTLCSDCHKEKTKKDLHNEQRG